MPAFVKHDLGQCVEGTIVEVTLAQDARVYLLDESNLGLYLRRRRFQGVGGPAAAGAAIRLSGLATGRWAVVVDLDGARGKIQASVRKLDPVAVGSAGVGTVPAAVTAEQLRGGGGRR